MALQSKYTIIGGIRGFAKYFFSFVVKIITVEANNIANNTIINTAPQANNQPANGNFVNGVNTNQQIQNGQQVQPAQAVNYSQPIPAGTTVANSSTIPLNII